MENGFIARMLGRLIIDVQNTVMHRGLLDIDKSLLTTRSSGAWNGSEGDICLSVVRRTAHVIL
jgi:hypothetical protein